MRPAGPLSQPAAGHCPPAPCHAVTHRVLRRPVIQGAEPSYERAIVVLRHPAHASLSYAAYSLSHAMSHDNVVDLAQMREHMASPSLPSLTNQVRSRSRRTKSAGGSCLPRSSRLLRCGFLNSGIITSGCTRCTPRLGWSV